MTAMRMWRRSRRGHRALGFRRIAPGALLLTGLLGVLLGCAPLLPPTVTADITLPDQGGANAVAYGLSSVWLAYGAPAHVLRVDAATGHVLFSTPAPVGVHEVAVSESAVWIIGNRSVSQIDPSTGRHLMDAPLPANTSGNSVAATEDAGWVAVNKFDGTGNHPSAVLLRYDRRTHQLVGQEALASHGYLPRVVRGARGDLFVSVLLAEPYGPPGSEDVLYRLDAQTGSITKVAFAPELYGLISGPCSSSSTPPNSALYAEYDASYNPPPGYSQGGYVLRFDPDTLQVTAQARFDNAYRPAVGHDGIWIAQTPRGPTVESRLDPVTLALTGSVTLPSDYNYGVGGPVASCSSVFTSVFQAGQGHLVKVGPS